MSESKLLKVREVAERLGVCSSSVLTLIRNGRLPAVDVSVSRGVKPRWRIKQSDLETFLTPVNEKPASRPRKRRQVGPSVEQVF